MIKKTGILLCSTSLLVGCSGFTSKQKPAPVYGQVDSSGRPLSRDNNAVISAPVTTKPITVQDSTILNQQDVEVKPQAKSSNVVVALLAGADNLYQQGNIDESVTTIERALRIEPRNALLLYKLAVLKLAQEELELAINLAKKSALLAEGNGGLKKKNWLLIADIYAQQGDLANANAARRKAEQF
ncbi:MAG: tetratricopeptide repeat protein [Methyloprofundus sp.]|nr:tetratricopeptide repeat protein [Methyloprofundus sp.]MBW6453175.1 tetratricopeptide repeat protein [Methyloprofundus sp.]